MAELHPNQIAFQAGDTAKANIESPRDYLSDALSQAALVIDSAADQIAKYNDVALAGSVNAAMEAGRQNALTGDSVNGDYSVLKNDALDYYQKAFEGFDEATIVRFNRQNPDSLALYETAIESIIAERTIKSADIRIRQEIPKLASYVALGQMTREQAIASIQTLGSEYTTTDAYKSYMYALDSDVERFIMESNLSGDMQSALHAKELLDDPSKLQTLTATDRARYKQRAQQRIDSMIESMIPKEGDKDSKFKSYKEYIYNSAWDARNKGNKEALKDFKDRVNNVGVNGYVEIPITDKDGNDTFRIIKYDELSPAQWGEIRGELAKIEFETPEGKLQKIEEANVIRKLDSNVQQNIPSTKDSDIAKLSNVLNSNEGRAIELLGEDGVGKAKLRVDEYIDTIAMNMRPNIDITTPTNRQRRVLGFNVPWTTFEDKNPALASAEYVEQQQNKRSAIEKSAGYAIAARINISDLVAGTQADARQLTKRLVGDIYSGKNMEQLKLKAPAFTNAVVNMKALGLSEDDASNLIYSGSDSLNDREAIFTIDNVMQPLLENVYNGKNGPELKRGTLGYYVASFFTVWANMKDPNAVGNSFGIPMSAKVPTPYLADRLMNALSILEDTKMLNNRITEESISEADDAIKAVLGQNAVAVTPETQKAYKDFSYAVYSGMLHGNSEIISAFYPKTPYNYELQETQRINATYLTKRSKEE